MSIDLSKITALSDSYGAIAKLELGSKMIWSEAKPVKLYLQLPYYPGSSSITIDGVTYPNEEYPLGSTDTVTLEVLTGTEITCNVAYDAEAAANVTSPVPAYIQLNGKKLEEGTGSYSHTFIVESTTSIILTNQVYYANGVYTGYSGYAIIEYIKAGSIILRPSADISVDEAITLTPSDATSAYLLVNEEVCDGAATTIGISGESASGHAKFSLDGNIPNISRVTDIYVVDCCDTGNFKYSSHVNAIILNDEVSYQFTPSSGTDYVPKVTIVSYKTDLSTSAGVSATIDDLLSEVNAYLSSNGKLPNMTLDVLVGASKKDDNSKEYGHAIVSQVCVAIEYE